MNSDGKISPSLTMTFVTREKKQKSKIIKKEIFQNLTKNLF